MPKRSINDLLELINNQYPLEELDTGEFKKIKVGPMTFTTKQFSATGFGNVFIMTGTATLGLMKMDTLVINPFNLDMPLYSYDRINAGGNDTMIIEVYNTCINQNKKNLLSLDDINNKYQKIPNEKQKDAWYNDMMITTRIEKKGKKKDSLYFDELLTEYLNEYLNLSLTSSPCDEEEKRKVASVYTEGLLKNGGVSTDMFIKKKGQDFTERFFRNIMFATGK